MGFFPCSFAEHLDNVKCRDLQLGQYPFETRNLLFFCQLTYCSRITWKQLIPIQSLQIKCALHQKLRHPKNMAQTTIMDCLRSVAKSQMVIFYVTYSEVLFQNKNFPLFFSHWSLNFLFENKLLPSLQALTLIWLNVLSVFLIFLWGKHFWGGADGFTLKLLLYLSEWLGVGGWGLGIGVGGWGLGVGGCGCVVARIYILYICVL